MDKPPADGVLIASSKEAADELAKYEWEVAPKDIGALNEAVITPFEFALPGLTASKERRGSA